MPHSFLRQVRGRPVKLLFLLVSLGASFGFVAVVALIAHATWFRLPSAVAEQEYVSFARRTAEGFERISLGDFEKLRELVPDLEWFHVGTSRAEISTPGGSTVLDVHSVSREFFEVLGVDPAVGTLRAFGDGPAAVLGHSLWREMYGSRTDVVDDLLPVRGGLLPVPIVGVAPPGFGGIVAARSADVWVFGSAFGVDARDEMRMRYPGANVFAAVPAALGFADPVASLGTLLSAFRFDTRGVEVATRTDRSVAGGVETVITSRSTVRFGVSDGDRLAVVGGLETNPTARSEVLGKLAWLVAMVILLLALSLVLLIDFVLSGNAARREQQALEIAVGASPFDVFRQAVARNAFWIAVAAAAAGLCFGYVADVLLAVEPFSAYIGEPPDAARLAGLAVGGALLAMVFLLGMAYASWTVSRTMAGVPVVHREGAASVLRTVRVVVLFAAAGNLLIVLSLVGRYVGEARFSLGFGNTDASMLQIRSLDLISPPGVLRAHTDLLAALPGVRAVANVQTPPLRDPIRRGRLRGTPSLAEVPFHLNAVTAGFFDTLDVELLAGRIFDGAGEVVVSRSAALSLAGGIEDALGRPLAFQPDGSTTQGGADGGMVVVGVAADVAYGDYASRSTRMIYEAAQSDYGHWLIDHAGGRADLVGAVRGLPAFDGWAVSDLGTPAASYREQFMGRRSAEILLSCAAAFAVVLALAGVGNSLARTLSEARVSIGVRFAVGATPGDVSRSYFGGTMRDVAVAVAVVGGVALAVKLAALPVAEILQLWLLLPASACLAALCGLVLHTLVGQLARGSSVNVLMGGLESRAH